MKQGGPLPTPSVGNNDLYSLSFQCQNHIEGYVLVKPQLFTFAHAL